MNIALPAGTDDDGWLRAFDAIVPKVLRAFRPQVLVTQQGCDSHRDDPLAHLRLTIEGQRVICSASRPGSRTLRRQMVRDRRWGYDWVDVVPIAWAHLTAIAAGVPIPTQAPVPNDWRTLVKVALGQEAPARMGKRHDPPPAPLVGGIRPAGLPSTRQSCARKTWCTPN